MNKESCLLLQEETEKREGGGSFCQCQVMTSEWRPAPLHNLARNEQSQCCIAVQMCLISPIALDQRCSRCDATTQALDKREFNLNEWHSQTGTRNHPKISQTMKDLLFKCRMLIFCHYMSLYLYHR